MLAKVMTSIEKRVFGRGAFPTYESATRALLKFCVDHNSNDPALSNVRACLVALESGERSNAIAAYKKVSLGKDGFGDWWPPVTCPGENEEYVDLLFASLVERWHRLMESFSHGPP
jgi:hypothetical protein